MDKYDRDVPRLHLTLFPEQWKILLGAQDGGGGDVWPPPERRLPWGVLGSLNLDTVGWLLEETQEDKERLLGWGLGVPILTGTGKTRNLKFL